jgi:hypothetical protein
MSQDDPGQSRMGQGPERACGVADPELVERELVEPVEGLVAGPEPWRRLAAGPILRLRMVRRRAATLHCLHRSGS